MPFNSPERTGGSNREGFVGDQESHMLLSTIETHSSSFSEPDWKKITEAIEVVKSLYGDEERLDGTLSVNHKLRAGLNAIQRFSIHDADIVSAAFLHDVVEDFVEHKRAESYEESYLFLREAFGEKVEYLVKSVTTKNTKGLSEKDAHEYYWEHFKEAVRDPEVFYVKLADFLDNGLNFINLPNKKRRVRTARKYLPMYAVCIERLKQNDITIPKENINSLLEMLDVAEENARIIAEE